jgi:hypothetical protein
MIGLIILGALIFIAIISLAYGVDSRDESPDPRRSIYPVGLR